MSISPHVTSKRTGVLTGLLIPALQSNALCHKPVVHNIPYDVSPEEGSIVPHPEVFLACDGLKAGFFFSIQLAALNADLILKMGFQEL